MKNRGGWRVLVATDGTPEARRAVAVTVAFPWPAGTKASGVVGQRTLRARGRPRYVTMAFERMFRDVAQRATRILERRFPDVEVRVVDESPATAILDEARRLGADVIALGSRPRGMAGRLLLGSVSRHVVRHARCSSLVCRGPVREVGRVVVGVDGSLNSRRAVEAVGRLEAPRGGEVVVVTAVEPMRSPSTPFLPEALRRVVVSEVAAVHAEQLGAGRKWLAEAAATLKRSGWKVRTELRQGRPVAEILAIAGETRANLIVVGARGVGGVERILLGSVAEGILDRSPVSVLVVRP